MTIPVFPIICLILLCALAWWAAHQWIADAFWLKVTRTIIVVCLVLGLVNILGGGFGVSFR